MGGRIVKQWKEKLNIWGKWVGMTGVAIWVIFSLFDSKNAGYSTIEVLVLFSVLFFGYRYGAGAGTICATVCGMCISLFTGQLSYLAILAILGLMAGAFRALGKIGSVIGFATTAAGIGMLYPLDIGMDSWIELGIGIVLFWILPGYLTMPEEKRQTVVTVAPPMSDFDGSIGVRIRKIEEAFLELSKLFAGLEMEPAFGEEEMLWRCRYMENRMVFGEQMMELAEMMRSFREELGRSTDITMQVNQAIRERLTEMNLKVDRISMVEGENKRSELVITLCAEFGKSVPVKEIAEQLSRAIGRKLRPQGDRAGAVGAQLKTIRLEEETQFQMLYGVARTVKEESECSGDSFSFLELSGGKVLMSLCDGMGSGERAFEESKRAIELVEQLIEAGFHPQTVLRLVNQAFVMNEEFHPIAIDVAVADLYTGLCDFTKSGAAVTFIRHGEQIEILQSETLPIGILQETLPMESLYCLKDGDLVIMMTDGVLEAIQGNQKEDVLKEFCLTQQGRNPREIADKVLEFAIGQEENHTAKDDMTVLVAGIWKK